MNNFSFLCEVCGFETKDKKTASNHKQEHTQQQHFKCDECNKTIKRRSDFLKHVKEQHGTNRFNCNQCNYTTNRAYRLDEHKKIHIKKIKETVTQKINETVTPYKPPPQSTSTPTPQSTSTHPPQSTSQSTAPPQQHKSAFGGKMQERTWFIRKHKDPLRTLRDYKERIKHALSLSFNKDGPQKFYVVIKVTFFKTDKDGNKTDVSTFFHGGMHTLLRMNDFDQSFETSTNKIWIAFDAYLKNGSGWMLERVEQILLNTYKYEPILISTYIPTPKFIAGKHAIWNIQNKNDKKCFEYSVLAAKHHKEINNFERPSTYKKFL